MKISPLILLTATVTCFADTAAAAGPDHSTWDSLVRTYVNADAQVDYGGLKDRGLADLDSYLRAIAAPWPGGMTAAGRKAALINAYNALTVRWIVTHYPVQSIHKTNDPFQAARHTVAGRKVSLDQVEGELRNLKDPRIHAVLVCAAKSCPPLRREAYAAARLDAQLDDNTRVWLANPKLNEFMPDGKRASVSSIFKWYSGDFDSAGGVAAFLAQHAPEGKGGFLRVPGAKIEHKDYDWSLNDAASRGGAYSRWELYLDVVRNYPAVQWTAAGVLGVILVGLVWTIRRRGASTRNASLA